MIQVYSIRHFLIFCDIFMRFQTGSNFVHRKLLQFFFAALLCGHMDMEQIWGKACPTDHCVDNARQDMLQ